MKIAIMQPYFFPYIGYFQLMAAVDAFVFLDDVQYVKGSWMNRNRILQGSKPCWWSRPVLRDQPLVATMLQRRYAREADRTLIDQIQAAYGRTGAGRAMVDRVREWVDSGPDNLAEFNILSLRSLAGLLGLSPAWLRASELDVPREPGGVDRVLAICRAAGATHYVNAIGGIALYQEQTFERAGLELSFVGNLAPPDLAGEPSGYLSVMHGLATSGATAVAGQARQFRLLARAEAGAST